MPTKSVRVLQIHISANVDDEPPIPLRQLNAALSKWNHRLPRLSRSVTSFGEVEWSLRHEGRHSVSEVEQLARSLKAAMMPPGGHVVIFLLAQHYKGDKRLVRVEVTNDEIDVERGEEG